MRDKETCCRVPSLPPGQIEATSREIRDKETCFRVPNFAESPLDLSLISLWTSRGDFPRNWGQGNVFPCP